MVMEIFPIQCSEIRYQRIEAVLHSYTRHLYSSWILLWVSYVSMNTLSSDLTIPICTDNLLYDPLFSQVDPIVLRALNMLNLLSNARNGTDERELYDRIMANPNVSIIDIPFQESQMGMFLNKGLGLIGSLANRDMALVENSVFITLILQKGGCHFVLRNASLIHETADAISRSPLSVLVAKSMSENMQNYLQYRINAVSEMGTVNGLYETYSPSMYEGI